MKIARVLHNNEVFYGKVEDDQIYPLIGSLFTNERSFQTTGYPLAEVKLLAPVQPPNIYAIGLNYRRHAQETGALLPDRPLIFLKATTSLLAPNEEIVLPEMAPNEVDYEVELAVIIGKEARKVREDDALDYVLGYTIGNDVSARDCQKRLDRQWTRGKSFDTFCPLGPWIETELDPADVEVKTRLNGQVMQHSSTADLIFPVRYLISYLSHNFTLLPGTVILTGTPEGVGAARKVPVYLRSGDSIEMEIQGIGTLKNQVR